MEATYRRELNEAYMILPGETVCDDYTWKIQQGNVLPGLLPLQLRQVDGEIDYWFAVSDGRILEKVLAKRPLEYEELCQVLKSLAEILHQMEGYLLSPEHLILDPAFLYLGNRSAAAGQGRHYNEPDFQDLRICCHPAWEKDFYLQMRHLMQYFINKMDHSDAGEVEAAYRLFHVTEKEFFRIEEMLEIIAEEEKRASAEPSERKKGGIPAKSSYTPESSPKEQRRAGYGSSSRAADSRELSERRQRVEARIPVSQGRSENHRVSAKQEPGAEEVRGKSGRIRTLLWNCCLVIQVPGLLGILFSLWSKRQYAVIPYRILLPALLLLILGFLGQRVLGSNAVTNQEKAQSAEKTNRQFESEEEQTLSVDGQRKRQESMQGSRGRTEPSAAGRASFSVPVDQGTEILSGHFPGRDLPLLISGNPAEQENISLHKMPFLLGKGENADVVLPWTTVSREHARIDCRAGEYFLQDCHSTNGTFLNGKALEPEQMYTLRFGDEIQLADQRFIFHI